MAEPNTDEVMVVAQEQLSPEDMLLLEEMMQAAKKEAEAEEQKRRETLMVLATDIENKLSSRCSRRQTKEAEWIESYRLYLGNLSLGRILTAQDVFEVSSSDSHRPEYNLVKPKCKVAISQSVSAQFAGGDKNWNIFPSPSPDIDSREAALRAEAMEFEIEDQLNNARYGYQSRLAIEDRVILGTGVLKGPIPSRFAELTYDIVTDPQTGQTTTLPTYRVKNKPVLNRVDPWFFYPDDTVNDIDFASDTIEIHPMSPAHLAKLKKNEGFFYDTICEILKTPPKQWESKTFNQYASLTASGTNIWRDKYVVMEYHGPITEDQLKAVGIEPASPTEDKMYFGEVWVCQGYVIRLELSPLDGCMLPYAVCPWLPDPGSIFGFGMPQEIKDAQRVAQKTLNMLLDNASKSAGPVVIIDTKRIEDPNGDYEIGPNKVFTTTDYPLDSVDQAFKFFIVPNITSDLFPVLELAKVMAQEESGIQDIAGSLASPRVGADSATGMAIIDQNATTVSDFLNESWDDKVVEKVIKGFYHYNMQFNPKPEIMGDFEVDVRSPSELRRNQLVARDLEKISVEAPNNPEMMKILDQTNLQKARLAVLHLPNAGIIKSDAQIQQEAEEAAQNPQPDPEMLKIEVAMKELEVKQAQLQLEQQRLQFEVQQNQERAVMDHKERMSANEARFAESQARVLEAQANREIEMIKLAQKDEELRTKIMADLEKANMQLQGQKFIAGMQTQTKAWDIEVKREEAEIKRKQGTGY